MYGGRSGTVYMRRVFGSSASKTGHPTPLSNWQHHLDTDTRAAWPFSHSTVLLERDAQLRLAGPAPVAGAGAMLSCQPHRGMVWVLPSHGSCLPHRGRPDRKGSLAMHARPATRALLPSQFFPTLNGSDSRHWVAGHRINREFHDHVQHKFVPVTTLFHAKWALVVKKCAEDGIRTPKNPTQ